MLKHDIIFLPNLGYLLASGKFTSQLCAFSAQMVLKENCTNGPLNYELGCHNGQKENLCIGKVFICSISSTWLFGHSPGVSCRAGSQCLLCKPECGTPDCALWVHQPMRYVGGQYLSKNGLLFYPYIAPKLYLKLEKYALKKKKKAILIVTAGIISASAHLVPNSNFHAGSIYAA